MIRISFDPSALKGADAIWWADWSKRANAAIDQAREDARFHRKHSFRQPIWSQLKGWLLKNVFNGKCAYCETLIDAGFVGDAEHYRPKGEVHNRAVPVEISGQAHPGYYWLAYHWKNLIPSCQKCNSTHKGTEFPAAAYLADDSLDPDALDAAEQPLLLHPYRDDPSQHLVFGVKGIVAARDGSPKGQETIRVCGLDRDSLTRDRQRAQEDGWRNLVFKDDNDNADAFWTQARLGPYFQAVTQFIQLRLDRLSLGRSTSSSLDKPPAP